MKYRTTLIIAFTLLIAGCAPNPVRVEASYGDSVRSMVHNQIANPQAAANPDREPVLGLDGSKGENVLSEHVDNVSKPAQETTNEITLNVGK